jgi:hypothetical protein
LAGISALANNRVQTFFSRCQGCIIHDLASRFVPGRGSAMHHTVFDGFSRTVGGHVSPFDTVARTVATVFNAIKQALVPSAKGQPVPAFLPCDAKATLDCFSQRYGAMQADLQACLTESKTMTPKSTQISVARGCFMVAIAKSRKTVNDCNQIGCGAPGLWCNHWDSGTPQPPAIGLSLDICCPSQTSIAANATCSVRCSSNVPNFPGIPGHPAACPPGMVMNPDLCICVCDTAMISCPTGAALNPTTCTCV